MNKIMAFTLVSAAALMLSACEQQGPMEEAGEAVDDAAEDVADTIEDETGRR